MAGHLVRLSVAELERRDTPTTLPPGVAEAPFGPDYTGPVNSFLAEMTGDSVLDTVASAGAGGGPRVRVLDGATGRPVLDFFAYDPDFRGGVDVTIRDMDGDRVPDLITGAGPGGGPHVRVFDGRTGAPKASFFAYESSFRGGVRVAALDLDRSGRPELITTPAAGGGPVVKVFDGMTGAERVSLLVAPPESRSGVRLTAGVSYYHPPIFLVEIDGTAPFRLTGPSRPGEPLLRVCEPTEFPPGEYDTVNGAPPPIA